MEVLRPDFFLHLGVKRSFLLEVLVLQSWLIFPDIVNIGGKIFWTTAITDFVKKRKEEMQ